MLDIGKIGNSAVQPYSDALSQIDGWSRRRGRITRKFHAMFRIGGVNGRIERVWIRENENPGPPPFTPVVPYLSGDAWVVAGGATVSF